MQFAAIIYAAPLVAGAMVVALMIKPLFARPPRRPKARALDPGVEPLLFAFVDGVCDAVGTRGRPDRGRLRGQRLGTPRRRPLGVFSGELMLTIGLPLAAGSNSSSSPGCSPTTSGTSRRGRGCGCRTDPAVNVWFARVVYERDGWDEALAGWSSDNYFFIILLAACPAAVWLTRRVLWVLFRLGHLVSGFLSRQIESTPTVTRRGWSAASSPRPSGGSD